MRWSPHVTVAAVIGEADRYLLVEEELYGRRVLNQPAGHLEEGESLIEAVIREVREETCRIFQPNSVVGIYRWLTPMNKTYLRVCFAGTAGPELPDGRRDPVIKGVRWLTLEELRRSAAPPRSPMVERCILDATNRTPTPLEILHEMDIR